MAQTTRKNEFVAKLAEKLETTKKDATEIFYAYEAVFKESLQEVGDKVALRGFVTGEVVHVEARTGRNPKTGEAIDIEAKDKIKVKSSIK